jgi:hypothetical protein
MSVGQTAVRLFLSASKKEIASLMPGIHVLRLAAGSQA